MAILDRVKIGRNNLRTVAIPYLSCETLANEEIKIASLDGYTLTTGAQIKVKFLNANSVSTPKLKVGNTEAKNIVAYGNTAPALSWKAGSVVEFTYDGTNYVMTNFGALPEGTATGVPGELSNISYEQDQDNKKKFNITTTVSAPAPSTTPGYIHSGTAGDDAPRNISITITDAQAQVAVGTGSISEMATVMGPVVGSTETDYPVIGTADGIVSAGYISSNPTQAITTKYIQVEEKTATPLTTTQNIIPTSGKLLSKVTVEPISPVLTEKDIHFINKPVTGLSTDIMSASVNVYGVNGYYDIGTTASEITLGYSNPSQYPQVGTFEGGLGQVFKFASAAPSNLADIIGSTVYIESNAYTITSGEVTTASPGNYHYVKSGSTGLEMYFVSNGPETIHGITFENGTYYSSYQGSTFSKYAPSSSIYKLLGTGTFNLTKKTITNKIFCTTTEQTISATDTSGWGKVSYSSTNGVMRTLYTPTTTQANNFTFTHNYGVKPTEIIAICNDAAGSSPIDNKTLSEMFYNDAGQTIYQRWDGSATYGTDSCASIRAFSSDGSTGIYNVTENAFTIGSPDGSLKLPYGLSSSGVQLRMIIYTVFRRYTGT